ncbi:hypothetical protein SPAN111604_05520 [Sphingomonas antarctica]|uniref:phage tail tip lysozyme n=1 Tax=Sphingomonas antarctica TaxID=2040274 RepID=UPI0039EC1CB2
MSAYDDMIGNLLNAGGLAGQAFAQGDRDFQNKQLGNQRLREGQAQLADAQQKRIEDQQYQTDIQGYLANPTAQSRAAILAQHPLHAEAFKSAADMLDAPVRESHELQLYTLHNTAESGRVDLALKQVDGLITADRAAGHATDNWTQIRDDLASTDPAVQKQAMKDLSGNASLAFSASNPTKAKALGLLVDSPDYTLEAGAVRFHNGKEVARSPIIKDAAGNPYEATGPTGQPVAGVQPTGRALMSPKATSVAATLTDAGLPPAVVAGFMGNFHVEGGYDGAQGDGGSASGIAQWHKDRADTFQRIIGKSVTDASPEDQAKFVAWEMNNPVAAGMTVAKRDAILAAKTPAQAAALIDQHYERSSGRDRNVRMSAATAFADQYGQQGAPAPDAGGIPGYRRLTPDKPGIRQLTPQEATTRGLSADKVWEVRPDGGVQAIGDSAAKSAVPGNSDLSGDAYQQDLMKTNPSLARQAQAVLDTRLAYPPATARSPQAQALRAAVLQIDPSYDEQAFRRRADTIKQYTPGSPGPGSSMLSAATLINHIYELAQAAHELPDHSTSMQNSVSSWWAGQTNAPWLIKYNEGRKFVASELPKFLEGKAPTQGQVEEHMASYDPSKGKTGIQTALATDMD